MMLPRRSFRVYSLFATTVGGFANVTQHPASEAAPPARFCRHQLRAMCQNHSWPYPRPRDQESTMGEGRDGTVGGRS
jgi:hypothetical protein